MKRILLSLISLLLILSMLLVGCNDAGSSDNGGNNTPDTDNGGNTTPPPATDTTFTKTESYMPSEIFTQMKTYFEGTTTGFYPYDDRTNAPFVSTDVFAISDCVVKSITIPVFSTGKADEDGDFTFSIYIVPNDWASLRTELADPADPIVVKINAEEYELAENSLIRKFIKVDLTEYEIELSDKETLGFSHKDDTLIPARVLVKGTETVNGKSEKYAPAKYLIDNWDVVGYYYHDRSDDSFTYIDNSLFFDFELERTWESEAVYNALIAKQAEEQADYAMKIAAIKNAYAGKTISVLGDSISTFNGITNNATLGLADNPVYSKYTLGAAVYTYERTYWGKLAFEAGMELNIINSWGGGKVYGWNKIVNETTGKSYNYNDCMMRRSYNLAKDGVAPDLILLYYATNDMGGSYSSIQAATSSKYTGNLASGNLYQRLTATNKTKTDKEIVAEWFAEVEAFAAQGGYNPNDPATITFNSAGVSNIYTCWEAAYALSLQNIKRLYPEADIYCVTLPDRNHNSSTQPRLDKANLLIRALAEYFELGFVDQSKSGVTRANCIMYAADETGLHPNGKGHAALTKAIVDAIYENLTKE